MTRRRAIFIALFAIPALLGLVLYMFAGSKMAFDLALKTAKGAGFQIDASKISGNLLSNVKLEDVRVGSAFVNGTAKVARVKYPLWQLLTRRDLKLDVALEGAKVDFDPLKLPPADMNAPALPVNISLERASVQDVQVKLRGKFIEIPNISARILEQHDTSEKNLSGGLKLAIKTVTGAGTANVDYEISKDWVFKFDINADLDAKIARYWYKDIKSGRVLAHYTLDGDKLTGSGEIRDGVLEPISGILVSNVRGLVTHSVDGLISGHLKGTALKGPLELNVNVNTAFKKEKIDVTGWAEPKIKPALTAFKADLPASGKVRVTVTGGGWEKLEFAGKLFGTGRVLEFPLQNIVGDWAFNSPGDTLTANVQSNSRFLDAPVNAKANLNFKLLENLATVNASVTGKNVLGAPLEAAGTLRAKGDNIIYNLETKILNGTAKASGELLAGKNIAGSGDFSKLHVSIPFENLISGSFKLGGINTDIRIMGETNQNLLKIPGVKPSGFPGDFALRIKDGKLSGSAQLGEFAWIGDLERGQVSLKNLQLEPAGVVTANANYRLQGSNGVLTGKLRATSLSFQGATLQDASGPFTLEVGKRLNGYWSADKLEAFLQADRVRIKPRNWSVKYSGQQAKLSGDATYLFNGNLLGQLNAQTDYGVIRGTGQGKNIALDGNLSYLPLPGKTVSLLAKGSLQLSPFKLSTTASLSSSPNVLSGNVYATLGTSLMAGGQIFTAGNRKLELKFENGVLNSSGEVNLSAVDALLPKSSQGQISGVAKLEFVNTNGTAKVRAKAFGIPILANVSVKNNQVSTNAKVTSSLLKGATISGQVFPKIDASLTYGSVRASVNGQADNLKFKAFGMLPSKLELERLGLGAEIQKLGLDWNPDQIALTGTFKQNRVNLSGTVGKLEIQTGEYNLATRELNANWRGSFSARYQNKPITIENSAGQVSSNKTGINFNVTAKKLEGEFQNQRVNAVALNAKGSIAGSKINLDLSAQSVNANVQGQQLQASDLTARATYVSTQNFDLSLNASTLDANIQGQRLKASSLIASAKSDGQLRGNLNALSLVGKLAGTAFDLQNINASAQPVNGKLEVSAKVKTGNLTVQKNPVIVTNFELTGNLNTTNVNKLVTANFAAKINAESLNGKLGGISAKTQNLNANLVRVGSSITGNLNTGILAAIGKDWQIETKTLAANNLEIVPGKPLKFKTDLQISSAVGTYQKNPFKLEKTTASLNSSGNNLGFAVQSQALEGSFEGYQIQALQVLAKGQLENDKLQIQAVLGSANALKGTDQLLLSKLELNGQYNLKNGHASVAKFKTTNLAGNLGGDTLNAQMLEGDAELNTSRSGKFEDANLSGNVLGSLVQGVYAGQEFKLENFKLRATKQAAQYQAKLQASRAVGAWQKIKANFEQLELNAKLENQRLSADATGLRASGQFEEASANLAKFVFSGAMEGPRFSGKLETGKAFGTWQEVSASLNALTLEASSDNGVIQSKLTTAAASGTYQKAASANLEHVVLNAKLKDNIITGNLTGTRGTGEYQSAKGKLEQFKVSGKLENKIFAGDLEALQGVGYYQGATGNFEDLKLNANLNGNAIVGALTAQNANGAWKNIYGTLEHINFSGSWIDNQLNATLQAAKASGKSKDASANLEQIKLEGRFLDQQIFATLEASRGVGAYQKAKLDLSQFKANGSFIDNKLNAKLEAGHGAGSYQDISAKLEQLRLNAQVIGTELRGTLDAVSGDGGWQDASAKLGKLTLKAEKSGQKITGTLEAQTGSGAWKDVSLELQDFNANATLEDKNFNGQLNAKMGSGRWNSADFNLEQFRANADLIGKNVSGTLEGMAARAVRKGSSVNLGNFKSSGQLEGNKILVKLDADGANGKTDDFDRFLKEFNLANGQMKSQSVQLTSRNQKKPEISSIKQNPSGQGANIKLEKIQASLELQGKVLNGIVKASSGAGVLGKDALNAQTFQASAKLNGSNLDSSFKGGLNGTIQGQVFESKLNATLGLNLDHIMDSAWRGQLQSVSSGRSPKSEAWKLETNGVWSALNVSGNAPSGFLAAFAGTTLPKPLETLVNVNGLVGLPKLEFNAGVNANLGNGSNAMAVDSRVQGNLNTWNATANLQDAQGGKATISGDSSMKGEVALEKLNLGLFTGTQSLVSGRVKLEKKRLNGTLGSEVFGFPIKANWLPDGSFNASVGGALPITLNAASWTFPLEVSKLSINSEKSDYPLEISAISNLEFGATSGQLLEASGTLRVLNYSQTVPGGTVSLEPAELKFSASLGQVLGIRITRGTDALVFDGQRWNGGLSLPYSAWGQRATADVQVSGALTDPNFTLESSGVLNLSAKANLREFTANGDLDLTGTASALPKNIARTVQSGRLNFDASGKLGQKLEVNARLESVNAKVDGDAVRLSAYAKLEGQNWSVNGIAGLGQNSSSDFQISNAGLRANKLDLDLRLLRIVGVAASGRVSGSLDIPDFKLEAGSVALKLERVKAFDISADGTAQLEVGQLNAQLDGVLLGKYTFAISGGLYPQTNAKLNLDGLRGQLVGDAREHSRNLKLNADGTLLKKITTLEASLIGSQMTAKAAWDAANLNATAELNSSGVKGTGHVVVSSLAGLEDILGQKLEGSLQSDLEFQNLDVTAHNLTGTVEGVKFAGTVQYQDAQLEAQQMKLEYQNATAELHGSLYPNLKANFTGDSGFNFAPAKFLGSATGTIEHPKVSATAVLGTANVGLIAPGSTLEAGFDGRRFSVSITGDQVLGLIEGSLDGLEQVNLRLKKAKAVYQDSSFELDGTLSWAQGAGFGGTLNAGGDLLGKPAKLELIGRNDLALALNWRDGRVNAVLPGNITKNLNAKLELERFDIGALWRKPGQLTLAANGEAHGNWANPTVNLIGILGDAGDDLDAKLNASYENGIAKAQLEGEKVKVSANLRDGKWQASGEFKQVQLEPLLPVNLGTLEVSGALTASDDGQGLQANLSNLQANGKLERIGEVSLVGSAQYAADKATTNLNAKLLGGDLSVVGTLDSSLKSEGINAKMTGINLQSFGVQGIVDGTAKLFGNASNPDVIGDLKLEKFRPGNQDDWTASALVGVSGKLLNPQLEADATFSGSASGKLKLSARDLFTVTNIAVAGKAKVYGVEFDGMLAGNYPKLAGVADVRLPGLPKTISSVNLRGTGDGQYQIKLENAVPNSMPRFAQTAQGSIKLETGEDRLNPKLSGSLTLGLDLNSVLESAAGRASGNAVLSGSVFKPNFNFTGNVTQPKFSSITAPDMKLFVNFANEKLASKALFDGGEISWDGLSASVTNLELAAPGQKLKLNSSGITSPALDLGFTGVLSGTADGEIGGRYTKDNLNLDINARSNGISAKGNANANQAKGWTGLIALSDLPKQSLYGVEPENSGVASLQLSGAFDAPKLEGDVYALGMRLGLTASLQPQLEVKLESKLNPDPNGANLGGVQTNGAMTLDAAGKLSGTLEYSERATTIRLSPSGTLAQPRATLEANQGKLNAKASVSLLGNDLLNDLRATLEVQDGTNTGQFTLEKSKLVGKMPKLDLAALQLEGYGGSLSLDANLELQNSNVFFKGTAKANWSNVKTPFEIPALGWQIDGTGSAFFSSENNKPAQIALDYAGTPGTAKGQFQLENDLWQGDLKLDLNGKNKKGKIQGQITLDSKGIQGKLLAQSFPIEASGLSATTTATIVLNQDSFTASGTAQTLGGRARFEGSGGISNLLPALEAYTHSAPDSNPYSINASLDTVKLEEIAVVHQFAPNAKGRIYGGLQIVDGITSFLISVPDLTLPSTTDNNSAGETHVRLQVSGSAADSSIRFKGTLGSSRQPVQSETETALKLNSYGDSDFQGSYDGENITGNLDLRNAPFHALLGSVFGALPGTALVTGVARYDIPIKNPLLGNVKASFEKLEIGEGQDALIGAASAVFSKGNLELDSLRLRSKNGGEWLGSGRYSKNLVNLKLGFSNTSFTPVLDLLPTLRGLNPEASGTLNLELKGEYGKPDAVLNVENFKGRLAGVRLNAKQLNGTLQNNKLEIKGQITTDESFNAALDTTATANLVSWTPIKLENLEARATGSLEVSPLGRLENINARAFGDSGGFKLEASATKGGALTITGDISPRLNLKLVGKDLVFKIPDYFLSDSSMDANLEMRGDGRDYLMTGNVTVNRALGSLNQGKTETKPVSTPAPQTEQRKNPVFERIKFQGIRIKAPSGLKINESLLKLEAGGDLQLGGTLAAPELNGAVEALEVSGSKGVLKLGSYNYNLSSVNASFNQVSGIYPTIRLVGKTTFTTALRSIGDPNDIKSRPIEVTLVLTVTFKRDSEGNLKIKTDTQLSSIAPDGFANPTEADLYSLVTLNSSQGISIGGVSQSAINTVLTVFILNEVSRAFKEQTGLDLNIDTNLFDELLNKPEDARNINVSFSIGADLTDQLRLGVNVNLGRTDFSSNRILQSTIFLNYTTTDNAFSVKFALPFEVQNNTSTNTAQFTGFDPEASFSWNFASIWSLTFGIELKDFLKEFRFKLGVTFRF